MKKKVLIAWRAYVIYFVILMLVTIYLLSLENYFVFAFMFAAIHTLIVMKVDTLGDIENKRRDSQC